MNKKLKYIVLNSLIILTSLFYSCQHNITYPKNVQESKIIRQYKAKVLDYISGMKRIVSKTDKRKISLIKNEIDFSTLTINDLKTTEKLIIINKKISKYKKTKAIERFLFFLNDGEIVRGNKVVFEDHLEFKKHNELIISTLNRTKEKFNYSGKMSFYSPTGLKYLENTFENDKIEINGVLNTKKNSKSNDIELYLDWYWVTTFNSDQQQTWDYLFSAYASEFNLVNFGHLYSNNK